MKLTRNLLLATSILSLANVALATQYQCPTTVTLANQTVTIPGPAIFTAKISSSNLDGIYHYANESGLPAPTIINQNNNGVGTVKCTYFLDNSPYPITISTAANGYKPGNTNWIVNPPMPTVCNTFDVNACIFQK